jgi:hypothetical protein
MQTNWEEKITKCLLPKTQVMQLQVRFSKSLYKIITSRPSLNLYFRKKIGFWFVTAGKS